MRPVEVRSHSFTRNDALFCRLVARFGQTLRHFRGHGGQWTAGALDGHTCVCLRVIGYISQFGEGAGAIGGADAFSGCMDQCSAYPGLLQDFRKNWVVGGRAMGRRQHRKGLTLHTAGEANQGGGTAVIRDS